MRFLSSVDTQPPGAAHVAEFDRQTGTSVVWTNVNATVGTELLLTIEDSTGLSKNSAVFPVTTGSGDGCLTSTGGSNPGKSSTTSALPSTAPASINPSSPPKSFTTASQFQSSVFGGTSTSSGSSTGTSSSSEGASIPPTRSFQSLSPTSSASSANTNSPAVQPGGQSNRAGPIAGGIVGGLVVVFSVLAFFLCRTRRRGQRGTFGDTEKEPSAQPLPATTTLQDEWTAAQLFSVLPSGETQLSSLPSQIVPSGILAEEGKVIGGPTTQFVQHDNPAGTELAKVHAPAEAALGPAIQPDNPNAQLLDEIRMLRHQVHAIEQRIQPQIQPTIPVMDQARAEEPPEYTS
ncbi:hypothetical protein MVEN_02098100 [Mycena venus]|uniref:Uncharacterized protein n=1 Tax=Mycena venus TaxID=2733690 RepID=A0A8H6X9N3_9AGAR|nr:hypothetical protein MVEN_02098100 [Mycena venus]